MNNNLINDEKVQILEHDVVYQGYFRVEKYKLRFRLFDGGWSETITREIFERGDAAGVLLYDPRLDKVVLIEQFRVGALQTLDPKKSPWLTELVAGIIEPEEDIKRSVIREAKEEAGLTVTTLEEICHYWVSPGGTSEHMWLFCGRVDASQAGGIYGLSEEMEDIRVIAIPFEDAFDKMISGDINNASTIIALQWLKLNKARLLGLWEYY